jgi:dihydrofolate synthase/folylpolyglutamate synthase
MESTDSLSTLLESLFEQRRGRTDLQPLRQIDPGHHRLYKTIHIAGTNGKGSVSTKIAASCQKAGFKTGLFTSPHIQRANERIQVDGVPISDEDLKRLLQNGRKAENFFDTLTLLAFAYFLEQGVEIAVIEAGIGGLLDATNLITPIASAITSIAFDHRDLLGDTLEEIALQKAGIAKKGVPLILGPRARQNSIFAYAKQIGALPLLAPDQGPLFDDENRSTAKAVLDSIGIAPTRLDALPPCRLETAYGALFDVAHNPDGIAALLSALKKKFPSPFHFFAAFSKGKEASACAKLLSREGPLSAIRICLPRMEPPEHWTEGPIFDSVEEALESLQGMPIFCGSFYLMAEAKGAMRRRVGEPERHL